MLIGNGWAFAHIPKCGGSSVRAMLEGIEDGSVLPLGAKAAVRSPWHRIPRRRPDGAVFTLVRHPAHWLRSFWVDQSPERLGKKRYLHRYWRADLNRFAVAVCRNHPGYVSQLFRAYTEAWRDVQVYRLEDGPEKAVRKATGMKCERVRENQSGEKPAFTHSTLQMILECEHEALERYGYLRDNAGSE